MLHEIKSFQFVLRNYENLLFVYFVVYNGKNEKHTKSEQDCESDWISFLNLAAKIQNIKVMKKIILMFLMMLMPIYMFPTSVTCLYYKWHTKQRSLSSSSLSLMEKSGNVILSSKGEIHNADIVVTYNDGIVMKFYSYSSVDSPMVVLSEDEIPQEGCYVKISQGDKYVLYQVTKD